MKDVLRNFIPLPFSGSKKNINDEKFNKTVNSKSILNNLFQVSNLDVSMEKEILWCCDVKALIKQSISMEHRRTTTNTKNKSKIY